MKDSALRVFGDLLIERTVFETEGQMRLYAVSMHDLDEIAIGQNLALLGAESEKPVNGSLGMVYRNRRSQSSQLTGANQHQKPLDASKR
jgi:hypothetical protein